MSFTRRVVLYEDNWLIAIDKPADVLSHPNPGKALRSCAFEGRYDPEERRFSAPGGPLWLIHRLDQDTSGVLLAAKNKEIAIQLRQFFQEQKVQKTYLALVAGRPTPHSGIWKDYLEKRVAQGMVRSVGRSGHPPNAELKYVVEAFYMGGVGRKQGQGWISFLKIALLTGRTHQIRVQAALRKHPLAGDRIYGDFEFNRELRHRIGLRRLFLHARNLELLHPVSGQPLKLEASLPKELKIPLGCLQEKCSPKNPKR